MTNEQLISDLLERTRKNMNAAEGLLQLSDEELNKRPHAEAWSALECIEHLNRYGDFYLPEITQRIFNPRQVSDQHVFKSGWLGNYFAKSMLPKEQLNKMKTFTNMNPGGSDLDKSALEKFIHQQKRMLDLLNKSRTVDMNRTRTSISISNVIKLKLGDTFRVVIYHNDRHILQAQRAAGIIS